VSQEGALRFERQSLSDGSQTGRPLWIGVLTSKKDAGPEVDGS